MGLLYSEKTFYIHTNYADCNDFIRPSAVMDFCQDMAGINAKLVGVGFQDMVQKGYYWVVLYNQFEVIGRRPHVDEDVLVKTWPKPRGKLEFEREYEICELDGTPLIKVISNWVVIDKNTRMISRAKDVEYGGEFYEKQNYPEKQKRKLGLVAESFDKEIDYKVEITDLDHNGHMNNARYLDLVLNMEDPNNIREFKKVEIAFIHEVVMGDTIHVGHYVDLDGDDCYIGNVGNELAFEVKMKF